RWWRGPVTVYGDWPNQPSHVIPFFTSMMNERQAERASAAAHRKAFDFNERRPLRILFIGRLSAAKNVNSILDAVARLKDHTVRIECEIVGEGPERARLEKYTDELGIHDRVHFAGGVEFDQALNYYEGADALALVSETEGWPKAIAEAMAFGLICIGSNRGLIPMMLGEGRGIVIPPGDADALTSALRHILDNADIYKEMSERAAEWAGNYSLEGLKQAIGELLSERCRWRIQIKLNAKSRPLASTEKRNIETTKIRTEELATELTEGT